MKKILIFGLIAVLVLGGIFALGRTQLLSQSSQGEMSYAPSGAVEDRTTSNMASPQAPMEQVKEEQAVTGEKIIRNVDYEVRSKTFDEDLAFFQGLPGKFGGEAESIDQGVGYYTQPDQRYYRVTYRIPTDNLTEFMNALEKDRVIYHKSFNQYSVTDSYNQTEARLKTLLATQERYLALLEKAENISDIIAVEQALSNVNSEIEWLSQTKDSYDKDINYTAVSLLLIEVSQSDALSGRQSFWGEIRDAFVSGIATFFEGLKQLVILILRLWPILILIGIGIAVYLVRRKKHKPTE